MLKVVETNFVDNKIVGTNMNRDDMIVDMQSPTPLDLYRFKSNGIVDIVYYKSGSSYSLEIHDSSTDKPLVLENCSSSMLKTWKVIEILRKKAYVDNKIVNVLDRDSKATYKKLSIANTLLEEEKQEAVERQAKRTVSVRRRMVVGTPYHSRKRKKIDSRLIRPILREEKTW